MVTDPPYNVDYGGTINGKDRNIANDNLSEDEFYQFLLSFYKAAEANLKKGAPVYVFHSTKEDSHGFEITSKIFMHKIYSQLGWDIKNRYRVYGKHYEKDNVVVFSFENCEIITDEEANNEG